MSFKNYRDIIDKLETTKDETFDAMLEALQVIVDEVGWYSENDKPYPNREEGQLENMLLRTFGEIVFTVECASFRELLAELERFEGKTIDESTAGQILARLLRKRQRNDLKEYIEKRLEAVKAKKAEKAK
jgi:hypothetical protein